MRFSPVQDAAILFSSPLEHSGLLLLAEHIKKEDEILFPWLDKELAEEQIVELTQKFDKEDREIGVEPQKYLSYLDNLEDQFKR